MAATATHPLCVGTLCAISNPDHDSAGKHRHTTRQRYSSALPTPFTNCSNIKADFSATPATLTGSVAPWASTGSTQRERFGAWASVSAGSLGPSGTSHFTHKTCLGPHRLPSLIPEPTFPGKLKHSASQRKYPGNAIKTQRKPRTFATVSSQSL